MGKFLDLAAEVGALVDEKNAAYGNSFGEVGDFLRILYPNGISPDQYTDALCVVRIFDKLKRIASNKGAFNESPYKDIVGYGLLGLEKDTRIQQKIESIKSYTKSFIPDVTLASGETLEEEAPSIARPAAPKEKVPVNCAICGKFLAEVEKGLAGAHKYFAHEDCYKEKAAAVENITETPVKINV
ncbi:MAG: hypothetical protein WC761_01605 [Candidatus Paceibacterota bacterium]|jgi:hypothetical protein